MVFLLGVPFLDRALVKKSLESFYGIGHLQSSRILAKFHIFPAARLNTLPPRTISAITAELTTMKIENELRKQMQDNIKRLKDMGSYRGRRHAMGLPVRGQRTRAQITTARKLNKIERMN